MISVSFVLQSYFSVPVHKTHRFPHFLWVFVHVMWNLDYTNLYAVFLLTCLSDGLQPKPCNGEKRTVLFPWSTRPGRHLSQNRVPHGQYSAGGFHCQPAPQPCSLEFRKWKVCCSALSLLSDSVEAHRRGFHCWPSWLPFWPFYIYLLCCFQ